MPHLAPALAQWQHALALKPALAAQDDAVHAALARVTPHGHFPQWLATIAALPAPDNKPIDLQSAAVTATGDTPPGLEAGLRALQPWRKGPFDLYGVHIDSEWRSDLKFARLLAAGVDFAGKHILDVGCGSGALTIACAKGNPACQALGVDLWRGVYASFSQRICEENAAAEGVTNVEFRPGDALKLDFPDESFDAVTSNYVYHNIPKISGQTMLEETLRVLKKGGVFAIHDIMERGKYGDMEAFAAKLKDEGYEEVKLLDTAKGMFMSQGEARFMCCSASKLLVGRK